MEHKIKLSKVQFESLNQIQEQKKQLQNIFQELNQKESLITTLILDIKEVDSAKVESLKLDGEFLCYTEKEAKVEVVKPKKVKAVKKDEDKS